MSIRKKAMKILTGKRPSFVVIDEIGVDPVTQATREIGFEEAFRQRKKAEERLNAARKPE